MKFPMSKIAAVLALVLPVAAHATLQSRDLDGDMSTVEAYYDSHQNITWLADANYRGTLYPAFTYGDMDWQLAVDWAADVSIVDTVHGLTYDAWRLPGTSEFDSSCSIQSSKGGDGGYGCVNSEMGHLFYEELGGVAGQSITTTHNANFSLFDNVKSNRYWSGNQATWYGLPFEFDMSNGEQGFAPPEQQYYAWLVSNGDVGIPVPEADTWMLLLAGLGMVRIAARSRIARRW